MTAASIRPRESGLRTVLLDRKETVGLPLSCGEALPTYAELVRFVPGLADRAVSGGGMEELFDLPGSVVAGPIAAMDFLAPEGRRYRADLRGVMIHRELLDQHFAAEAVRAGAELRLRTKVVAIGEDGEGPVVETNRGTIRARILVGADGPLSLVSRSEPRFPENRDLCRCSFVLAEGDFEEEEIELHFRKRWRGGYFWYFPKRGRANIGLGVRGPALTRPLLVEELARISRSRRLTVLVWGGGVVPLSGLKRRFTTPTKALVGDAAGMVMPSNGGGTALAMAGGRLLGECIRNREPLARYEERARAVFGPPLRRSLHARHRIDAVGWSDRLLGGAMRIADRRGWEAFVVG